MASFLSQAAALAKSTAKVVADKTKETYHHLKAVPTEITCTGCKKTIMVPYSTFNWICGGCNKVNEHKDESCLGCHAAMPKNEFGYSIACTMCAAIVKVPTTNFEKGARSAAATTKEAATTAAVWSKEKYAHLKSAPERFNCEHCATELLNPNGNQEEQKQKAAEAAAAGQPLTTPVIESIICPVCKKTTKVPASNFSNSASKAVASLNKGASKLYYDVAGIRHAKCPICSAPAKAPEEIQKAAKDGAAEPARVQLTCPKCNTEFPAVV